MAPGELRGFPYSFGLVIPNFRVRPARGQRSFFGPEIGTWGNIYPGRDPSLPKGDPELDRAEVLSRVINALKRVPRGVRPEKFWRALVSEEAPEKNLWEGFLRGRGKIREDYPC